ncbi:MAG: hypothetical protein ACI9R3_004524 [Verrucomicrobiales bacterium]|jgi:hypothetical protein
MGFTRAALPSLFVIFLVNDGGLIAEEVPVDHATRMAASGEVFRTKVGPIFREHCLECHGGDKVKSGFSMANRAELLKGGDQGVAVVPQKPSKSPLVDYIRHKEEPFMPPKKPLLPAEEIDSIEHWILLGAAYDMPLANVSGQVAPLEISQEDRDYWAYRPLSNEQPPKVADDDWSGNGVDQFIAHEYTKLGLVPSNPIDRTKLIRRAYFDVIGLPPGSEAIESFLGPQSEDAFHQVVEALLESKHFGERWARHWLDVARFGESFGFEHDSDRAFAFHYRDFVIRAFNSDMPYDQFVRWQIAGDELAPDDPLALMGTGFLGAGVYPTQITINDAERARYDALDDMVGTMGTAMLATTIGCARCHDHKYDPIPTREYYSLLSAFTTTVRSEVPVETWKLDGSPQSEPEKVMICSEGAHIKPLTLHKSSGKIPDFYEQTYFLNRGDVNQKQGVAASGFLSVLMRDGANSNDWTVERPTESKTSMQRTRVARWITDTERGAGHLLARVIVNRIWQHYFGAGIVATPNDFGFQGEEPSHPELLDWLAGELIQNEWRLKHVHRLILNSRVYQLGDNGSTHAENHNIDPQNRFHWKRPARRLEAEAIRDAALSASGALDDTLYGPGTLDSKMKRRSVYFKVKRSKLIPMLQLFDWPDALTSLGRRSITTTPAQALVFINSPEIRELSELFAASLKESEDPVSEIYLRALGRAPSKQEHKNACAFVHQHSLIDFCQTLMGTNEFIYIE